MGRSKHAELLSFIRHCRSLDTAWNEIRDFGQISLRTGRKCGEVNAGLDTHIGHIEERIAELQSLQSHFGRQGTNAAAGERRTTVGFGGAWWCPR